MTKDTIKAAKFILEHCNWNPDVAAALIGHAKELAALQGSDLRELLCELASIRPPPTSASSTLWDR